MAVAPEHAPICIPFSVKHTLLNVFSFFWNDNWLEEKIKIYLQILSRFKNTTQAHTHVQQWGFVAWCYWPGVTGVAQNIYEFLAIVKCLPILAQGISNEKFIPKCIFSYFLSLHSFKWHVLCLLLESHIVSIHWVVITLACSLPFPIGFIFLYHVWLDFSLYLHISIAVIFRLLNFNIWIILLIYKS